MPRGRITRLLLLSALALCAAGAAAGRAVKPERRPPNILLIVSEDNGPELGCYGDRHARTPRLDRLAAEGVRFTRAFVTQAVCSPSRASILTGLYPHQNGQIGLATHAYTLAREWPTLPGVLKEAGYRTGLLGKLHVNPESAFAFDFRWSDPRYLSFARRDVRKTAEVAAEFMADGTRPFFLAVCYADAHLPFLAQQEGLPERVQTAAEVRTLPGVGVDTPRLREHAANYYNCMSRLDTGVGLLLDALRRTGREEETLVVYLGDHGPQFGRGKGSSYEFALRVPLLVRWPGRARRGLAREELVSTVDLMPTLLAAAGARAPAGLPGRGLLPLLRGEQPAWREYLFAEWNTSHPFPAPSLFYPQRSVRDRRHKLILNLLEGERNPTAEYYTGQALVQTGATAEEIAAAGERVRRAYATWHRPGRLELYDLRSDPHELENLADRPEHRAVRERLLAELTRWQRETGDPLADPAKLDRLHAEDREVRARPQGAREPGFRWRYPEYLYSRP